MSVGQGTSELMAIGELELEALPERAGPAAEQPGSRRALLRGAIERKPRQRTPSPMCALRTAHRDAPNQRVPPVTADHAYKSTIAFRSLTNSPDGERAA